MNLYKIIKKNIQIGMGLVGFCASFLAENILVGMQEIRGDNSVVGQKEQ